MYVKIILHCSLVFVNRHVNYQRLIERKEKVLSLLSDTSPCLKYGTTQPLLELTAGEKPRECGAASREFNSAMARRCARAPL